MKTSFFESLFKGYLVLWAAVFIINVILFVAALVIAIHFLAKVW